MDNSMGGPPWASHSIGLGVLNGTSMGLFYVPLEFLISLLWECIGRAHGDFHGIVLWVVDWAFAHMPSMELQWGFSWGNLWL